MGASISILSGKSIITFFSIIFHLFSDFSFIIKIMKNSNITAVGAPKKIKGTLFFRQL